jgi:hypothetical protein
MNANLKSLREEHEKLIVKAEEDPLPKDFLPQVDAFMQKVQKAGASVRDSLERDLLRSFLRYWGSYVYKHQGVYPNAELEPFTQLTPYPKKRKMVSPAFLLVAGALVLLTGAVALLSALGYLPVRQVPTPTATARPPTISEPRVGASRPLKPGEEASISIDVFSATSATLTYAWDADDGEIVRGQGSPMITYRAPDKPGTYLVGVVVVGWDGQTVYRATLINVEEEPTPTPTPPPPTATPVPLAETPTSAAMAECSFVSPFRIPIEGPSVDAEVRITSMENCADNLPTASSIPLAGTYAGDLTNKEIWILVYPPNLVYYPQSTNACANLSTPFDSGQWQEQIRLGRQGVPEAFHVVAIVAEVGSPASEAFHNYLNVGCQTHSYEGLAVIPPDATEMDSIIVHTK